MAGTTGNSSPSPRLVSGTVNGENNPAPGNVMGSSALAGGLVSSYAGQVGTRLILSAEDAGKFSNTANGTLYGGVYCYVKTNAAAANIARGRLAFWDLTVSEASYQVHQDETQNGGVPLIAGVFLNAITPGNYGWIQISGRATLQSRATVTAATRNIIWSGAGSGADNATVDGLANATAITGANLYSTFLGVAEQVAANGALIIVNLRPIISRQ